MLRIIFSLLIGTAGISGYAQLVDKVGPTPSAKQMAWQEMEYYFFMHFGPNTFSDLEWGKGTEDPSIFNPTDLDCRQWARIARDAGAKGIIITAKHHDGFCLWPSRFSEHTVAIEVWDDNAWQLVANGTTVGYKRIVQFPQQLVTKLRISITKSKASPVLGEIQVFDCEDYR